MPAGGEPHLYVIWYDEKRKIGNENDLVFGAINPESISISLHHRFI
jgi:hypothetical protein